MESGVGWGDLEHLCLWCALIISRLQPAAEPLEFNPTLHLPHLLRVLGPSTLTLYKHVLGRRRILIYTLPPVEAACILCRVAADMCYESQADHQSVSAEGGGHCRKLKGKCKEGIDVLGMVTLNDLDTLDHLGKRGRGWIACETDFTFSGCVVNENERHNRRNLSGKTVVLRPYYRSNDIDSLQSLETDLIYLTRLAAAIGFTGPVSSSIYYAMDLEWCKISKSYFIRYLLILILFSSVERT